MTLQDVPKVSSGSQDARHPAAATRPYWLVGTALLVLVVIALAGALLLDRRFRSPVGIEVGERPASSATAVTGSARASTTISNASELGRLNSPLERDVARAYLRYWDIYAEAMLTLDVSKLPEVTAAARLQEAQEEVADLKAGGVAARIQVAHRLRVLSATAQEASIWDEYVDSSFAVDPSTKQPIGAPGASERVISTYVLRLINGAWKVVGGRREAA